jgi:gliding motility-associated-like protein
LLPNILKPIFIQKELDYLSMKSLAILSLALLFSSLCLSQQGNNWNFGSNAGLSFNALPPLAFTGSALNTIEGCASISDNNGSPLFYTDGKFVWNRLNQQMPNGYGLKGHPSSANSAIIIPKPGSNTIFYVFTADAAEVTNANGYNYSEVDMTLNGGLGDVTSNKNIQLYAPSTEKLTAVRSSNGIDIWVVTKSWGNNAWYVYKVTCNGVDPNPVISNVGSVYNESSPQIYGGVPTISNDGSVGCLKASPDGQRIATTRIVPFGPNLWEIFNFNSTTGSLSGFIQIQQSAPYGLEFSPDSKLLYVATEEIAYGSGNIIQYDLTNYNLAAIQASAVQIGTSNPFTYMGALQLGPDNKIYCAEENFPNLGVITSPNTPGVACGYLNDAIDLKNQRAQRGLPVFFPSLLTHQNVSFTYVVNPDCSTVSFSGSSTVTGNLIYNWDFNDGTSAVGQNISHIFLAGGLNSYNVKLSVTSDVNCGQAFVQHQISLNRTTPISNYAVTHTCGTLSVQFTDESKVNGVPIQSWSWDFGDGSTSTDQNPVYTYASYGEYSVKLKVTSAGFCNGSTIDTVLVPIEAKPNSSFSMNVACRGRQTFFLDNSSIASGAIDKWYWNFGDGTTSSEQNPKKIYQDSKSVNIKFVASSSTGCISDTIYKQVSIGDQPTASWTVQDTCSSNVTLFSGLSTIQNSVVVSWYWDFGNGKYSNAQNPTNIYLSPDKYLVQMAANAANGCVSDTIKRIITIGSKPIAYFSDTNKCGSHTSTFTDLSSANGEQIKRWYWNFGDGNTSDQENTQNIYSQFNAYNVKLLVNSALGCSSDTVEKIVEIKPKPTANFTYKNGCINEPLTFEDISDISKGVIVQWKWDFGISVSNENAPIVLFTSPGVYQAKLVVLSDKLCLSDTSVHNISIETIPVSNFSISNSCVGSVVQIKNSNNIESGSIALTWWNFGDGNQSEMFNPVYRYATPGNFAIQEVAVSENGCVSDTISKIITIGPNPQIDFSFGSTCKGKEIPFQNNSSVSSGNIISWKWDFGNGDTTSAFQPEHTYFDFGNFPISLTGITDEHCSSMKTITVDITPVNVSAGNDTSVAIGEPLYLRGTGAQKYLWTPVYDLNDATSSHPIASLTESTEFVLTGTTEAGCVGYDTLFVRVFKNSDAYIPNAFTPNNDGKNDVFKPLLPGIVSLSYFNIYNRWGQLVFTTKEPGKGWDGYQNGVKADEGTYVWIFKAQDYQGKIIDKKGTVELIR